MFYNEISIFSTLCSDCHSTYWERDIVSSALKINQNRSQTKIGIQYTGIDVLSVLQSSKKLYQPYSRIYSPFND